MVHSCITVLLLVLHTCKKTDNNKLLFSGIAWYYGVTLYCRTLMIPGRSTSTILFNCGPYTVRAIGWRKEEREEGGEEEGGEREERKRRERRREGKKEGRREERREGRKERKVDTKALK